MSRGCPVLFGYFFIDRQPLSYPFKIAYSHNFCNIDFVYWTLCLPFGP